MKPTQQKLPWQANFKFVSNKIAVLLLFFTGMANAQIVNIPDSNFKSLLLLSAPNREIAANANDEWIAIDSNSNGEIEETEAQAIKKLNINQTLIFDLTGISAFTNLESFGIGESLITTLDLSALIHLKTLDCYNLRVVSNLNINSCTELTNLTLVNLQNLNSLNISNLSNVKTLTVYGTALSSFNANALISLTDLFYFGNAQTTTLTVNNLPNLKSINCGNNNLSILNINGLPSLTDLDCSTNKLTNLNGLLNVSKLYCNFNKLTSLNINTLTSLTELSCSGNDLTSLDVNGLTNLAKLTCAKTKITTLSLSGLPNLIALDCGSNRELTSVTLSNLPLLSEFRFIGDVSGSSQTLGNLNSLNFSGLPNLQKLICNYGKLTSLNLSNLSSLVELNCSSNLITSLNLSNLPNLQKLDFSRNRISTLDASGLPNLQELFCGGGYIDGGQFIGPLLTNLNVAGLSQLKKLYCNVNLLTNLDLSGLNSLEELYCGGGGAGLNGDISSLDVSGLTNLKKLYCAYQALTSLDVSNLTNLTDLYCQHNSITSLGLTNLPNLSTLDYSYNQLSNLNLVNLPNLGFLNCDYNNLVTLNVLNLTNLTYLSCQNNNLTTLNLSGLQNLITLDFSYNQMTLADIGGLSPNLISLSCMSNNLTTLDVSNLPNLESLNCNSNFLTSLDLSGLMNLKYLGCSNNQLSNLDISSLYNLISVGCASNSLTTLNVAGLSNLTDINCSFNQLTSLDLSNHTQLQGVDYSYNNIPNLDISSLPNLYLLAFNGTQTTAMDFSGQNRLSSISGTNNQLTTLDVSDCKNLIELNCNDNNLETILMKNGASESYFQFFNNPNLRYICADDAQLESIQTQLNGLGMNATVSNSYCTFTPGGNHNTITGITVFDADNDGCDVTDEVNPFIRLNINDNSVNGATVTNINGTYNFYTNAGNYVISPNTENPTWFNFSPGSANFSFPNNNNNISSQNFCITAVGQHKDVEVVFTQVLPARPGFDALYKIVYKNKGNQMHTGTVTLQFDDDRTDFVSASPDVDVTGTNLLTWNYENLMPFENRSILLTLNINQPTESPSVNNGDILPFTVSIPLNGDEVAEDNQFEYQQIVVGSYDPNDIYCLEGPTVAPSEIGKYLHYIVNFENTGSFYAENVVVRIQIDDTKFDMNSLQLLNSSNPSATRIVGNTAEFIMEGINLSAASGNPPVGGHGDVLFKIKTKDDLQTNDTVLQRAGIYFDYNFPVITNDAQTTFAVLNTPIFDFDNSVKVHPNPTHSIINIDSDFSINSIELYDLQGRILETVLETATSTKLDLSSKSNGIYFLKIKTEKGSKVEKIVKE